ncbi:hypothetical protein ACP4OV_031911 [Aristida adscensionis]
MEPPDCQSRNQDNGFGAHSDESSDTSDHDVDMVGVQEEPSSNQIDIDRAIDLMRFVFKEGLALLDNGSDRPLHERMLVDMSGYMVSQMFQDPDVSQRNGPRRMRLSTPTLENEIAHAFVKETRKSIAGEMQGDFFGIYVDVRSTEFKSYMVLFVRYLNGKGEVVERLLGNLPEPEVRDSALKQAVDSMLSEAGLSWSNVRGQGHGLLGYDDDIVTELKTSIFNENASGYHVHPYLCQLHSTLIAASYDQFEVYELLQIIDVLSKLVKDCPQFTEKVCTLIKERGVNLDNDLKKPGETSWGSYYEALMKFAAYLTPIWDALEFVEEAVSVHDHRHLAYKILKGLCYDFAFALLLMQDVLSVTNELSLALDREDLDAENCMTLLQEAKKQLQVMRDEGWTPFINKAGMFCSENEIPMLNMGANFKPPRWEKEAPTTTNLERYHVGFFEKVINIHLNELEKCFSEQSSALVLLSSCLNPRNSFQVFDKDKLVEYARFYPSDFSDFDIAALDFQLQAFIADVRSDVRFREMNTLSALSVKMVETGKNSTYQLVYLLLKLALILPCWTPASAKTASSAMKFIHKTVTIEPWNECLLLYLEREIVENITNDAIIASL